MVIIPTPTRLQLCLVEVPYQQPSCIPSHHNLPSPVVAVFQGQPELFEASVSVGSNLTFTWHFSDTNETHVQQLYSVYNFTGHPQDATSSKQVSHYLYGLNSVQDMNLHNLSCKTCPFTFHYEILEKASRGGVLVV